MSSIRPGNRDFYKFHQSSVYFLYGLYPSSLPFTVLPALGLSSLHWVCPLCSESVLFALYPSYLLSIRPLCSVSVLFFARGLCSGEVYSLIEPPVNLSTILHLVRALSSPCSFQARVKWDQEGFINRFLLLYRRTDLLLFGRSPEIRVDGSTDKQIYLQGDFESS